MNPTRCEDPTRCSCQRIHFDEVWNDEVWDDQHRPDDVPAQRQPLATTVERERLSPDDEGRMRRVYM